MPEPTGETKVVTESESPALITVSEGLISAEAQARITESMAPKEPIVDEAAQRLAQAKILENQNRLSQISAEAVEAARTAREAYGVKE